MSFIDNVRRRFASIGTAPPFKKDDPRSVGAGVIKRLKLQNSNFGYSTENKYEEHIGSNRMYLNVYLADPIVRTLIDLPCLYAVKDCFDIVIFIENIISIWAPISYI